MICLSCGNETYFECEVETMQAAVAEQGGMSISEAIFEGFDQGEEMLRGGLMDNVHATLKLHANDLCRDYLSGRYYNPYLYCAVCHGREVTFPCSDWTPPREHLPLHEELLRHHAEYQSLKEEKRHANKLPVLWQP